MKKYILILLAFISAQAFAQLSQTATYDFNSPLQLNPSITPDTENGGIVNVTKTVFTSGPVSLSFQPGSVPTGAQIFTYISVFEEEGTTYSLRITQTTVATVSIGNGYSLDSILFIGYNGNLTLQSGQPGSIKKVGSNMQWNAKTKNVQSVNFSNNGDPARITQMYVYYTVPSVVLFPVSTSLSNGTVSSFRSLSLTFDRPMSVQNASGIKITGNGINRTMSASASGNTITLTTDEIKTDNDLTITIPASSFRSNDGYENVALTYNVKVAETRNTFAYESIAPEQGVVSELPNPILVTFTKPVKLAENSVDISKDGEWEMTASLSVSSSDANTVEIKHSGKVTRNGVYTITIPDGAIHTTAYGTASAEKNDRWNPSFSISYTVDESAGPTPGATDSETMKAAKALIGQAGQLGYPSTGSESYNALKTLVELSGTDNVPTDEELGLAMLNFYNETQVVMPETGKWYTIAGVNNAGKRLYLSLDDNGGRVGLTTSASQVGAFKATVSDDKVIFETLDGKYLHALTTKPGYDTNLTDDAESQEKNLTLAKFLASSVNGVDPQNLLGLFTISGAVGNSAEVFSLINHSNNTIINDNDRYFDATYSNAFELKETSEPKPVDPNAVTPDAMLNPREIASADETMTLTINNVDKATVKDSSKPYVADNMSGAKVSVAPTLTAMSERDYAFTVSVKGLAAGNYTLVLPTGTFTYELAGKTVNDVEMKVDFVVKGSKPDDPQHNPDPEKVSPAASISPAEISSNTQTLTLTITGIDQVTLKDDTKPRFTGTTVNSTAAKILTTGPSANTFIVHPDGLADGTYSLVLPTGTFAYVHSGKEVEDRELKVTFTIKTTSEPVNPDSDPEPDPDFSYTYHNYNYYQFVAGDYPMSDASLNEVTFYMQYTNYYNDMAANPAKQVRLARYRDNLTIATGHFEDYPSFNKVPDANAIRLVYDAPIKANSLSTGMYTFVIPAATFGDANFRKWVKDHNSVKPSDCKVNRELFVHVYVNNVLAGIDDVQMDESQKQVIFDLTGRKIDQISKPGVYIINGKKRVVK